MHADGHPFVIKLFLLLAIFGLGFLLVRNLYSLISGPLDPKIRSYAAADSSPMPTKSKAEKPSPKFSPAAVLPAESKEEVSTSLRQESVKNPSIDPGSSGSLELGNRQNKNSGLNARSLREDEGIGPVGHLRTGADAKPVGSLRSPAESGITGSLRLDDRALPTGSLREDEGSLPTGNLR